MRLLVTNGSDVVPGPSTTSLCPQTAGMTGDVVRPWFEELKRVVSTN
jgi:hypothetical protein